MMIINKSKNGQRVKPFFLFLADPCESVVAKACFIIRYQSCVILQASDPLKKKTRYGYCLMNNAFNVFIKLPFKKKFITALRLFSQVVDRELVQAGYFVEDPIILNLKKHCGSNRWINPYFFFNAGA